MLISHLILLNIYRCFNDGLKIFMFFFVVFFFRILIFAHFYLDYFQFLILLKYVESIYLVQKTGRTLFSAFRVVLCMMCGSRFLVRT